MQKPLLDVLFASEKRKNTLLLLRDGPREMDAILSLLKTTRQALLPQIKILEDNYLVEKCNSDSYELSVTGKILVDKFTPLLCTLEVLGADVSYWGERYLDFIPPHLLNRLCELDNCNVIEPDFPEMYELNKDFVEDCKKSKSVNAIISFSHPDFGSFCMDSETKGVDVSIIISNELYDGVKADASKYADFRKVLRMKNIVFYLYLQKLDFMAFTLNDNSFLFRLLTRSHQYDSKQLLCSGPGAVKWGNDFFEYVRQRSVLLNE